MAATGDDAHLLLALPTAEVIRHGLISNRGMLVVGAGFAALSQISPRLLPDLVEDWGRTLFDSLDLSHFGPVQFAIGAVTLLAGFVLLLQLLSVALSLLQYSGFRLTETGPRLTIERGLLTRMRTSASRRRIQAWTLRESLLQRLLGRRSLQVDTATSRHQSEQRAFREIAPVATPPRCDALVQTLLPHVQWPLVHWQPLDARAWWRLAIPGVLFAAALTATLYWHFGLPGLLGALWLPWALLAAHRNGQRAGYAFHGEVIAVREGWWSRYWRFAEVGKLQTVRLRRSPMDRRFGTASLWLDTAGAGSFAPPLRIRFLPAGDAATLQVRLAATIAQRPLRW